MSSYPSGIRFVKKTGWIVVADMMNNRIVIVTPDGGWITSFGTSGGELGQMMHPSDVAIADESIIIVSEWTGQRLQLFTMSGAAIRIIRTLGHKECYGVAYDERNKRIVAVDRDVVGWSVFSLEGECVYRRTAAAAGCPLYRPCGIGVNEAGEILVSDAERNTIQKFSQAGAWLGILTQGHTSDFEASTALQGGPVVMRAPPRVPTPPAGAGPPAAQNAGAAAAGGAAAGGAAGAGGPAQAGAAGAVNNMARAQELARINEEEFFKAGRRFAFPCLFDISGPRVIVACILSNSIESIFDPAVPFNRRKAFVGFMACTRDRDKYTRKFGLTLPESAIISDIEAAMAETRDKFLQLRGRPASSDELAHIRSNLVAGKPILGLLRGTELVEVAKNGRTHAPERDSSDGHVQHILLTRSGGGRPAGVIGHPEPPTWAPVAGQRPAPGASSLAFQDAHRQARAPPLVGYQDAPNARIAVPDGDLGDAPSTDSEGEDPYERRDGSAPRSHQRHRHPANQQVRARGPPPVPPHSQAVDAPVQAGAGESPYMMIDLPTWTSAQRGASIARGPAPEQVTTAGSAPTKRSRPSPSQSPVDMRARRLATADDTHSTGHPHAWDHPQPIDPIHVPRHRPQHAIGAAHLQSALSLRNTSGPAALPSRSDGEDGLLGGAATVSAARAPPLHGRRLEDLRFGYEYTQPHHSARADWDSTPGLPGRDHSTPAPTLYSAFPYASTISGTRGLSGDSAHMSTASVGHPPATHGFVVGFPHQQVFVPATSFPGGTPIFFAAAAMPPVATAPLPRTGDESSAMRATADDFSLPALVDHRAPRLRPVPGHPAPASSAMMRGSSQHPIDAVVGASAPVSLPGGESSLSTFTGDVSQPLTGSDVYFESTDSLRHF